MQKTIIDILKKGNLELFHSSMIAWLLNPQESHGLGKEFLEMFLSEANKRKQLLINLEKIDYRNVRVNTEVKYKNHRVDIEIDVSGTKIVIENKTKTTGSLEQLTKYAKHGFIVIALGLFHELFPFNTKEEFPILTYSDINEFIKRLDLSDVPPNFKTLIVEYQTYLDNELGEFRKVNDYYGGISSDAPGLSADENDIRTYNHFFLKKFEHFRRENQPQWFSNEESRHWHNKNMRSGVWYAFRSNNFLWNDEIHKFRMEQSINEKPLSLWFHVELWAKNGVISKQDNEECGEIQIKSNQCKHGNKEIFTLMEKHLQEKNLDHTYRFPRTKNQNSSTFFVLSKTLKRCDLRMEKLHETLESFCRLFGQLRQD